MQHMMKLGHPHADIANVKIGEVGGGKEGAAGYLFLFNISASRWGPCMFTIWAHNYLSDVAGKGCLWSTNTTCQQHTLIILSYEEVCWFTNEGFIMW